MCVLWKLSRFPCGTPGQSRRDRSTRCFSSENGWISFLNEETSAAGLGQGAGSAPAAVCASWAVFPSVGAFGEPGPGWGDGTRLCWALEERQKPGF